MNWFGLINALKRYDYSFFAIGLIIFIIGVLNLYSATHTSEYLQGLYKTQIMWFVLSLFVGVFLSFIRPKTIFKYAWPVYILSICMLTLVLFLGHRGMGARRWLFIGSFGFQPSEITKVVLVLVLGKWFTKKNIEGTLGMKGLVVPFIITIIPVVLIAMEPDLGTALILLLTFSVVAFYRNLQWKTISILAFLALISGYLMYNFGLEKYQKARIMTFLNPGEDTRGSGYNAIQSKIAIGSGRVLGKGLMKSSQASLQYLPEKHTDFVFSIFSEEHGFVGVLLIILLYTILLFRFLWVADSVPRIFDSVVMVGLMSIFFWHIFINMSMVMGIMPIVGLPLPYMSYGGSSLLTFGICCGIATSISNFRMTVSGNLDTSLPK
ncbi:MAG: rod shape-determining protein RodA [Bacteriovoracales bacterium]|nr:rod shape-determining protein RodA [Bacteriovoracales bacterium]